MGGNYCKNIVYDNCTLSRFDAHRGVNGATIRNSTIGIHGLTVIGSGQLLVENSTLYGAYVVTLRQDYGSSWEGEVVVRDCTFIPRWDNIYLVWGSNRGNHNFGYTCYMPERFTFENLTIEDDNRPSSYTGPRVFFNFNSDMLDNSYVEEFPYVTTKQVILKNVTTTSGKDIRLSNNPYMFRNVEVISS
jgi:hypothetical protein